MPKLLVKKKPGTGRVAHVTPENAGWAYVGFDLHRLEAGDSVSEDTGGREVCLVLVSGKARVSVGGRDFGLIGERYAGARARVAEEIVAGLVGEVHRLQKIEMRGRQGLGEPDARRLPGRGVVLRLRLRRLDAVGLQGLAPAVAAPHRAPARVLEEAEQGLFVVAAQQAQLRPLGVA